MANPVLRSPYAAFGYLPSNGDDSVVADERRAAYKPLARRYATFLILERLRRLVPTVSHLVILGVLSSRANRLLNHAKFSNREPECGGGSDPAGSAHRNGVRGKRGNRRAS